MRKGRKESSGMGAEAGLRMFSVMAVAMLISRVGDSENSEVSVAEVNRISVIIEG